MYGLIRMLGNQLKSSPQEPVRKSKAREGRTFLLNAINLAGKVLPWRLTTLRETDLSGLYAEALCGFHREQDFMGERGNQFIGACLQF